MDRHQVMSPGQSSGSEMGNGEVTSCSPVPKRFLTSMGMSVRSHGEKVLALKMIWQGRHHGEFGLRKRAHVWHDFCI